MNNSPEADDHLAALHPPPARPAPTTEPWCRLYREARAVALRLEVENARLRADLAEVMTDRNQWIANSRENRLIANSNLRDCDAALAEVAQLRAALAEAKSGAPTGLEYRGG